MYLNILLLNKILLHYNLSYFSSFLFQFITNIYNHTQNSKFIIHKFNWQYSEFSIVLLCKTYNLQSFVCSSQF